MNEEKAGSVSYTLHELKKQRGTLKGRLTLFEKFVSKLPDELNSAQIIDLELRIQSTSELFKLFNDVQSSLEDIVEESQLGSQLEYREQFEELYYSIISTAKCRLNKNDKVHSPEVSAKTVPIRLPEIKLTTFSGSYDTWLEYRNSYLTIIHNRQDLNEIQKFHYLKSSLSGSALQVISALEFTAPNYSHAWELLENRFHNNRLLVQNHVKALFATQALSNESPLQIRKLIDTTMRNLRALKSLNEPTESWDTLIVYLITSKLDPATQREWETHKGTLLSSLQSDSQNVSLEDLLTFLRNKADMIDMIKSNNNRSSGQSDNTKLQHDLKQSNANQHKRYNHSNLNPLSHTQTFISTQSRSNMDNHKYKQRRQCVLCNIDHPLYACAKFLNLSVHDRIKYVTEKNLCQNCLRSDSHKSDECSFGTCKLCKLKHNSLICTAQEKRSTDDMRKVLTCNESTPVQPVLLSTALVDVADADNNYHTVKVLLDNGSQNCILSESLCKRLNIPTIQSTIRISGVGQVVSQPTQTCNINMRSKVNDFDINIQCLVIPKITSKLPSMDINVKSINIPNHIKLSDPTFHIASEVEMLIGADIFWDLLEEGRLKLTAGPYLQNSKVGWIISGPIRYKGVRKSENNVLCNHVQIESQLKKFWELEEIGEMPSTISNEERFCEKLFSETTKRDESGRFSVRMPLKESPADSLDDSYTTAEKRFMSLERKLDRTPHHKKAYCDFMQQYEAMGHMSPVLENVQEFKAPYYVLPHHGVYRDSFTSPLRVVFDGSAATSTGKSLNDIQYAGPPLQNEIFSILLQFRQYKYVACADIEKCFRQILIQSDQRNLQLILWRSDRNLPIRLYRLNTVTYGTASAPYLSMRCLRQLAIECDDDRVARAITNNFYVDDFIYSCDDLDTLLDICTKTNKVLQNGCFPLRKWTFNFDASTEGTRRDLNMGEHCQSKTLGLGWSNEADEMHFTTKFTEIETDIVTKRVIMSIISQIYDPLGLLAPAVIVCKVLLQRLWLAKIDWDSEIPVQRMATWRNFMASLQSLHTIRIPRHITVSTALVRELHVFTDASQSAYGACAYIRSLDSSDNVHVRLLCAKGKVAPLKPVSIPRLELCGALLGAKLYDKIKGTLSLKLDKIYFWTDSTIVQCWLRTPPHTLKTFVQNRVVQINELTSDIPFLHVKGKSNPADLITRGVSLESLRYDNNSLWWCGPSFLLEPNQKWHTDDVASIRTSELPEVKPQTVNLLSTTSCELFELQRFSSFTRLQRAGAYLLRFIHNARASRTRLDRITGALSVEELDSSLVMLTRIVQRQSFPTEYSNLESKLPVTTKGKRGINQISGLNIFLDDQKLIRVGGRLNNSDAFSYDKKHPMLLSSKHRFASLLCSQEHKRLLHAAPQLLIYNMRNKWWVLGARNLAKHVVHKCVICARIKGQTLTPIMGNLPSERLDASFPFMRCGVDFAGPLLILDRKGRGAKLIKAYICLFICFTTRCIDLQLVGGLSTQDYLLALKRFISRRGKPFEIFSDNGKNFVGAEKELVGIFQHSQDIDFGANQGIRLRFIPVFSPHFGGLWEAGVRSSKYFIKRILGNAHLTYEEFATVLAQIEAVLNSRPVSPMSTDPNDYLPLTPAHFLIGRPLTAPACVELTTANPTRLSRYDRVEQLRQHFWQRWSSEYVSELQRRTKWKVDSKDLALNSMVLIKEDNLPPLKWRMGRIIRLFPGKDGVARVAEIRTATGIIRRAFSKICPLPEQPTNEESTTSYLQEESSRQAANSD